MTSQPFGRDINETLMVVLLLIKKTKLNKQFFFRILKFTYMCVCVCVCLHCCPLGLLWLPAALNKTDCYANVSWPQNLVNLNQITDKIYRDVIKHHGRASTHPSKTHRTPSKPAAVTQGAAWPWGQKMKALGSERVITYWEKASGG